MIYLSIKGRLGNQMFQYAFARALQEKLSKNILIDWHHVLESDKNEPGVGFQNSLKDFHVAPFDSIDNSQYKKYMSFSQQMAFRKYEKTFPYGGSILEKQKFETDFYHKHKKQGMFYFENGYLDFDLSKVPKNVFLSGYFESTEYFKNIENELKDEFTPKQDKLEHNKKLYEDIENSQSVCVSVRRGDFLKSAFHNVCRTEYFMQGMDIIKEKVPNAKFFIFSNDVQWIKENVDFKYPVVFEEGSDPVWEKLRLMYSCKHFVLSNSTFSWWAQYLSRNENKVVVAPDRWFNDEFKSELLNNDSFIKIVCK